MNETIVKSSNVKPFVFDEGKVNAKIEALRKDMAAKSGKPNYNPYLFDQEKLVPLLNVYNKGIRSEELFNQFMSLPSEIPAMFLIATDTVSVVNAEQTKKA